MSEEERVEKSKVDDRIDLLIRMLDDASQIPGPGGSSAFTENAISALKMKFPCSAAFYAGAEQMRTASRLATKNDFVDPFVVAARIGFAYAILVVREWQAMTGACAPEAFSEGPDDGTCKG